MGECRGRQARLPPGTAAVPARPLAGGASHVWEPDATAVRIYHRGRYFSAATEHRGFGPFEGRFDHHPAGPPRETPGYGVLYLGATLDTSVCEALAARAVEVLPGGPRVVEVCPSLYVGYVHPLRRAVLQDLVGDSPAALGAPEDLGDGPYHRADTQHWGRAIHGDRPAAPQVAGIRYWSSCHREGAAARHGVNVVLWEHAPPLAVRDVLGTGSDREVPVRHGEMRRRIEPLLAASGISMRMLGAHECAACAAT